MKRQNEGVLLHVPFLYRYSLPFFFHKASLFLAWVLAMPRAPYPFQAPIRGG